MQACRLHLKSLAPLDHEAQSSPSRAMPAQNKRQAALALRGPMNMVTMLKIASGKALKATPNGIRRDLSTRAAKTENLAIYIFYRIYFFWLVIIKAEVSRLFGRI